MLLSIGTFAVGTDAFVVAGLLPDLSRSLDIGIGAAGQVITVFSIAYAIAAIGLSPLVGRWSRRPTLVLALGVFVVGNALSALAPTFPTLLLARIVAAVGAAAFTATASATAAELAGRERQGRAIALVMLGLTASLVLGAPLGTAVGTAVGWRATLWAVAALGVIAAAALTAGLPRTTAHGDGGLDVLAPVRDRATRGALASAFLVFVGVYLPYSYISAVYEPLTAAGVSLTVVLLVFGVAASAGNLLAGRLADRFGPRRVIVVAAAALGIGFAIIPLVRDVPALAIALLAFSGWVSFSLTTPQQVELLTVAPAPGPRVTAWYQATIYAAVSVSGVVGAAVLSAAGPSTLALVAAGLMLVAAAARGVRRERSREDRAQRTPAASGPAR